MSKIHFLSIITALILSCGTVFSQITVTNTQTVTQLVNNVLTGAGVISSNITVNGSAALANTIQPNASYFNQNSTTFTIQEGLLLTTGIGTIAVGPNNIGSLSNNAGTTIVNDPDMDAISTANITNGIVLEFDFIATGNLLSFDYVWASEEYPEFVNAGVNDCFGFFLSGPGLSGPYEFGGVNIALIPGTSIPISIDNVNAATNALYYVNNVSGAQYGTAIQYDGTTTVLTAFSDLICGETYHIKLGIANVGDQGWDSGVFLEAGSFTTNPIDFTFNSFTLDNTVSEGCDELGTLMFTRQGCGNENDTLIGYTTFTGTAINGVDYELLGDSVVLLPGIDTVFWQLLPEEDGFLEGIESVIITVAVIEPITGDTLYSTGQFFISDVPEIIIDPVDVTYLCFQGDSPITATVSGGFEPYEYLWENGSTDVTTQVPISGNGVTYHTVTITDACGYVEIDSVKVTMNQTISIDNIELIQPATCEPVGIIAPIISGATNPINIIFDWEYLEDPSFVFADQGPQTNLSGGTYVLTLIDDNIPCSVSDTIFVPTIENPVANGSVNPDNDCSPLVATFTNTSQNATSYTWDFGNGNVQTVSNTSPISQTYTNNATITLTASNGFPACDDEITLSVQVVLCGCTNPIALNYDATAVIDDGSCVLPTPTVIAPNVFTANGDDINPFFMLTTTNAEKIELTIVNRWGNLIYEGNGNQLLPPFWDGKDKSGNLVEDGVYFYTYLVTGVAGDEVEGHGFVEVVK